MDVCTRHAVKEKSILGDLHHGWDFTDHIRPASTVAKQMNGKGGVSLFISLTVGYIRQHRGTVTSQKATRYSVSVYTYKY